MWGTASSTSILSTNGETTPARVDRTETPQRKTNFLRCPRRNFRNPVKIRKLSYISANFMVAPFIGYGRSAVA